MTDKSAIDFATLLTRIDRLDRGIDELRSLLLAQKSAKEHYSTAEAAELLGKAEFTVREWCRLGRVRALKRGSGRGKYLSWVISAEELGRFRREGLLPRR